MSIIIKLDPNGNINSTFNPRMANGESINYKGVLFLGDYTTPPHPTPNVSIVPSLTPTPTPTITPTNTITPTPSVTPPILSSTFGLASWNPLDKSAGIILSDGDKVASTITSDDRCRSTTSYNTGKKYAEVKYASYLNDYSPYFGLIKDTVSISSSFFFGEDGWIIAPDLFDSCSVLYNGLFSSGISPITTNGRAMMAVDFDSGNIWLGANGVWANGGDPASDYLPTFSTTPNQTLFLGLDIKFGSSAEIHLMAPTWLPVGFDEWI